jgi:hypothetical protein
MLGVALWVLLRAALAVAAAAEDRPLRDVIDAEVTAAWQREKITPAEPASDAEFLRRVHLDLVGVIPTYDETVAFLADTAAHGSRQTPAADRSAAGRSAPFPAAGRRVGHGALRPQSAGL